MPFQYFASLHCLPTNKTALTKRFTEDDDWLNSISRCFDHSKTALGVLEDIRSVMVDRTINGRWYINDDPAQAAVELRNRPLYLGYAHATGNTSETITAIWNQQITPQLRELPNDAQMASVSFLSVVSGDRAKHMDILSEISEMIPWNDEPQSSLLRVGLAFSDQLHEQVHVSLISAHDVITEKGFQYYRRG